MSSFCGNSDCLNRSRLLPEPPVSDKFRQYEQLALRIRSFAGLTGIHDRLNPYALAESVGLRVVPLDSIAGLSDETKALLQSTVNGAWSGGATPMLPDGTHVVILNPSHSETRKMATLMEEICHVLLGHQHSEITTKESAEAARTHNQQIEEEAYSVGAAALLPYRALTCNLSRGQSIRTIAAQAGVSQALVRYRIKVLRLAQYLA